jgi:hypothetical protein
MIKLYLRGALSLFASAALLVATGCGRESGPPAPLSAETLPAELEKAYTKASPELKEVVQGVKLAMGNKDYAAAHQAIQYLSNAPEATEEQRLTATRAMLTITGLLQAAAAQGDQKAAAALQNYQLNK